MIVTILRMRGCAFITCFFLSQMANGQVTSSLNKDSLKKDFALLYELLTKVNPASDMYVNPDDYQVYYDSLQTSITNNTQLYQFYYKTSVLAAKVFDGHTGVNKDAVRKTVFSKKLFPFSVFAIHSDYYISKTGLKELDSLIGKKIVSINKTNIQTIIKKIKSGCSLEAGNQTGINTYLQDFPFHYYLLDTSSTFIVTVADTSGKMQTLTIPGVTYKSFKLRTVKLVDPVKYEFIDNKIALLTVNTFSIEDLVYKNIDYKKYLDKFFSEVKDKEIQKLIIDVRGNGGGSAEVSSYLFSHLTDTAYYYFDYVGRRCKNPVDYKKYCANPEFLNAVDTAKNPFKNGLYCETETPAKDYWWFELQKGKKRHFEGNVSVLTDGGSFSTTGHFLALFTYYKRGNVYGECSQGSDYSNDASLMFTLPYSKLEVKIPTARYQMRLPKFEHNSEGICPDVQILKKPTDLKTGYDRPLQELIKTLSQ